MICKICGKEIPENNKKISKHIDELLDASFIGWSEDAMHGYLTACETIRHKDYHPIRLVTYEDFFISTNGIFIECDIPNLEPNFTSTPTVLGHTPSKYWYGTDEIGDYIIRRANHWCHFYSSEHNNTVRSQNNKIVKCVWHYRFNNPIMWHEIIIGQHYTGKIYLKDLKHR